MTTGQKFWCLSIFLKYIEFMIYYLNSCQCFSQSEFHPSPERNATSVRSVFLETAGCLKQPYHRVRMLDKLLQVCRAQGQPHACPCKFVCPKCRRLLPTSTWVRDTACRNCKHVQHFGKASCTVSQEKLWLTFACTKPEFQSVAVVDVSAIFSSSWWLGC